MFLNEPPIDHHSYVPQGSSLKVVSIYLSFVSLFFTQQLYLHCKLPVARLPSIELLGCSSLALSSRQPHRHLFPHWRNRQLSAGSQPQQPFSLWWFYETDFDSKSFYLCLDQKLDALCVLFQQMAILITKHLTCIASVLACAYQVNWNSIHGSLFLFNILLSCLVQQL